MHQDVYDSYIQAGDIAARGIRLGLSMIKVDVSYLSVAEAVEDYILGLGAKLAFPANISVNDIAAHYSPKHNDALLFSLGDVVKLDVGAIVDGYIGDTARTVEVGTNNWQRLIEASEDGFNAALPMMHNGMDTSIIGTAVQSAICAKGFRPIDNLTGHSLERYLLHGSMSMPSVPVSCGIIRTGHVFAIEPFATSGVGSVSSEKGSHIYGAKNLNNGLPFSKRQIPAKQAIEYPLFREVSGGIVSQFENTVIVTESEPVVTTK